MPMTDAVRHYGAHAVTASRAAAELGLRRGEFALAVHLGMVRSGEPRAGGRAKVRQDEIDRLRSEDGFPETLRERVRTVGTAEGARLLGISPVRFTRLARAGCVTPVAFYLNRYRVVVWLYLAQELGALAARSPGLLVGNSPPWLRSRLDTGADWRARNWRSRRVERLLTLTEDPWVRAAVIAEALDPVQLAEVVDDPYERAYLGRVRPVPVFGQGRSAAGREAMAKLMLADEPDEILWRRVTLGMELDSARELRPAPRPGEEWGAETADEARASAEVAVMAGSVRVTEESTGPVSAADPVGSAGPSGPDEAAAVRSGPGSQGDGSQGAGAQEGSAEGGSGQATTGGGGSGAAGFLARFRLRGTRGGRRPLQAAAGRGKPLATSTRTRHSLHHADQGSHR